MMKKEMSPLVFFRFFSWAYITHEDSQTSSAKFGRSLLKEKY